MRHNLFLKSLFMALMLPICANAQNATTSSSVIQAGTWAVHVPYQISDSGTEYQFMSGMGGWSWDFFGLQMRNYSGINHQGGTNGLGIARIGFTGRFDASYTSLSSTQTSAIDTELNNIAATGVKNVFLLCGIGNAGNSQGSAPSTPSWTNTQRNNYVNDIERAANYVISKGYTIYAVAPFNEPDYETTYSGNASNFNAVAQIMQTKSVLAGKVYGPSTLNSSQASTWYNTVKSNINFANTHQLAGNSFTDWTGFWQTAKNDGKTPVADEMHNVMEMMACVYYGGTAGAWWAYNGVTRGEYTNMLNEGVQLAYKERPNEWMIATVNKRKDDGRTAAFIGSSERQGVATAFTFFSRDRLAYYDGYGPVYDYTQDMPGGASGSYSNGQTNTERTINISYGEDVPIEPINGRYKIVNKATGKIITLNNGDATTRDNVYQWRDGGKSNQTWDVLPVATSHSDFSYVYIRNANTSTMNLYLDAEAWNMNPSANVSAWSDSNTADANDWQLWHLTYIADGYYTIRNFLTGLYMDVDNSNTADGTNIMQWSGNGGDNQLWKFIPADHSVDTTNPSQPTGLTATAQPASILLKWTANTDADIYRYMIYRYNSDISSWECIGRKISGTSFIDNTCPKGVSLRYRIRALDKSYNLSNPSEEVTSQTLTDQALIAYWTGSSLNDNTVNSMNGVSNGVTFTSDEDHSAIVFDGNDDYVELPYYLGDLNQMTFAAWVKGGSTTSWQRLFDFGNGEDEYIFLTPTNGSNLRFEIKANGTTQGLNANSTLDTGTWKHVAVTIGDGGVKIYIDGTLNANTTAVTLRPSDVKPKLAFLGRSMFDADPAFKGSMSDVRIYNYELSASDIQQLANMTVSDDKYEITAERIPNIADNVNNWDTHSGAWTTYTGTENGATNMSSPYVRTGSATANSTLSKTLNYLPEGNYEMQANCYAYYIGSRNAQEIFANTATLTINSENSRVGVLRTLTGLVSSDYSLEFGYRTTSTNTRQIATNLAMDNVRLFFLGTKEQYINGLVDISYEKIGDAANLLNVAMNKDVKQALRTAIENVTTSLTALQTAITNDSSTPAIVKTWTDALDAFTPALVANAQSSASAYATLKTAIDAAQTKADEFPQTNGGLDKFDYELGAVNDNYLAGEYLDSDIPEIVIETKRIANRYVMTDAVVEARTTNAVNVTELVMSGAGFDNDYVSPEWNYSPNPTAVTYGSLEYWNTNFNIYQVVYGLPEGTYRFETRGFYRYGGQAENYTAYNNGTLERNAKIYIVDSDGTITGDIMAISDDPSETHLWGNWSQQLYDGNPVPDNMQAASEAIDVRGKYVPRDGLNSVTLEYSSGGDITVGVRKDVLVEADWSFFGDFSLYYLGNFVNLDEMSSALPANNTRSADVNIDLTRTISADQWNTICLPFDMSKQQIAEVFGEDAVVKELASVTNTNGNMILNFNAVDNMVANKPYIINGATPGFNYIIKGVKYSPSDIISITVDGLVFQGNYTYPTVLDNQGGQDYYLTNNLFKSSKGGTKIKGFRAYFKDPMNMIKTLNFNADDGLSTSVSAIEAEDGSYVVLPANIYSADGRLVRKNAYDLNGLNRGIYIIQNKKVYVK